MKGLFKGLATTLSTALRRPVTVQYPEVKHPLPVRQRSFPVLTWDFDHDEPFCTGCMVCVRNCPVECMTAVMADNPRYPLGLSNRRKSIEKFWIDYGRCMRCNICVEVCNFEAIVMDNTWGAHNRPAFDRRDLHMDLDELTKASRSGHLPAPFRPVDEADAAIARIEGKEIPEAGMKGARPEARQAQFERIAAGKGAAIQEREPEPGALKAAAAAAGAAEGEELAGLSEKKLRAKRMRAEKEAREAAIAEGRDPEAAAAEARKAFEASVSGGGAPRAAAAPAAAAVGAKGDPNSPSKIRARRMRAEKEAREKAVAEGRDPEAAVAEARAAFEASLGGAAAPAAAATAADAGGGAPSANKLRAKRMREEREASEKAIAEGTDPEAAVAEVRARWGVQ